MRSSLRLIALGALLLLCIAAPAAAQNTQPAISAPATASGAEGSTFSISATATDPDAGEILTITVTGQPPVVPFSAISGPSPLTATLTGTPGYGDAGTYTVRWTVTDRDGLSASAITNLFIANTNRAPVLNPVSNMGAFMGGCGGPSTDDQEISATDPDGDAITFTFTGPAFATLTSNAQTGNTRTGNIHVAPPPGTTPMNYPASVTATANGLSDTESFTITIAVVNQAPVLAQPATMSVNEGATVDQTIFGSDPCGAPLTFTKVTGPTFMTVTTTSPTTGNVHLAPGSSDSGTYTAVVRASNGSLTNDKSFTITVNNPANRPPDLAQPANMTICGALDQTITASDPDGDALVFSKVAGPVWVTVTTTSPTTGNIHLAPPIGVSGTFEATVRASDGSLNSDRSFTITITQSCQAPVLHAIADMTVVEGETADQVITAIDPNGAPLTFVRNSGPLFMTVATTNPGSGNATGNIHLAPGLADAGTYTAVVSVRNQILSHSRSFTITVISSGNRCPSANAGGPYSGLVGVAVDFNGTASSDPDGNPLSYAWDFDASNGIGVDATGPTPSHAYAASGAFTVTLVVTDNGDGDPAQVCSNSATTTANITASCPATVFNGYDEIKLQSGKPTWFAFVQPQGGCYSNSDVVLSSFVLKYAGRQIPALVGKTSVGGDRNGDGIQEIRVTFSKENLRTLFSGTGLANGHNLVTVTLEANLITGGKLQGETQVDVVSNGSFTVATVAPNPLNPVSTLRYATSKAGPVRIDMFDIQGRLVRRIVDEPAMAAGSHEATIDGRGERGEKLPSGVYFVRGTSAEGEFKRIVTILK